MVFEHPNRLDETKRSRSDEGILLPTVLGSMGAGPYLKACGGFGSIIATEPAFLAEAGVGAAAAFTTCKIWTEIFARLDALVDAGGAV